MAEAFAVLDPDQNSVTVCGVLVEGGFADGDMVTIVPESDAFITKVGATGAVTRIKTNNKLCTITLRLMQASIYNTILSALHQLDILVPNGAGVGPTIIKDLSGTSLYFFSKSWIAKAPDVTRGMDDNAMEWKIQGILDERLDGSN